ncbi:Protein EARLY FLOWERING [Dionaea muscipula]
MKGGNHEDTVPLFPRLHVHQTEKGGPRPPPRNKMALYEQLSIPSQRAGGKSSSSDVRLVGPRSPCHGDISEKNLFVPLYIPGSGVFGKDMNMMINPKNTSPELNYRILNAEGSNSQAAKRNLFQTHDNSPSKRPRHRKVEEEFRVPMLSCFGLGLGSGLHQSGFDRGRSNLSIANSSRQLQAVGGAMLKSSSTREIESELVRIRAVKGSRAQESEEHRIMSSPLVAVGNNTSSNTLSKPCDNQVMSKPSDNQVSEPSKHALNFASLDSQNLPFDPAGMSSLQSGARNELGKQMLKLCRRDEINEQLKSLTKNTVSVIRSEPCSRSSPVDVQRNTHGIANASHHHESNRLQTSRTAAENGKSDIVHSGKEDSAFGVLISPDDVVGVIGQTHFWKARKTLLNQQRTFSTQVFELHRLIKVQESLAASLHVLENSLHLGSHSSIEASSIKQLEHVSVQPESPPRSPPQAQTQPLPLPLPPQSTPPLPPPPPPPPPPQLQPFQSRVDPVKNALSTEYPVIKPALAPVSYDMTKAALSGSKASATSMGMDPKMGMWRYQPPPGNQWLVPVMSPSEGLIYKPFTGFFPGFIPNIYSGFGPVTTIPVSGSAGFLSSPYAISASHQQGMGILPGISPTLPAYFVPYGTPIMPSPPAVQQGSPLAAVQSASNEFQGSNFYTTNQSSCGLPSEREGCCRGSDELHGTTPSNPPESTGKDALPLHPLFSTAHESQLTDRTSSSGRRTQVIKVIPHNPRLATKSAAFIFQSIQEERKQYAPCRTEN